MTISESEGFTTSRNTANENITGLRFSDLPPQDFLCRHDNAMHNIAKGAQNIRGAELTRRLVLLVRFSISGASLWRIILHPSAAREPLHQERTK